MKALQRIQESQQGGALFGIEIKHRVPGAGGFATVPVESAKDLIGGGAKVRVVDPQGEAEGRDLLPGVKWEDDPYKAARNADLVVLLTEWNEFRALDLKALARKMAQPRMVDLRNIYTAKSARQAGFETYIAVGR